MRRADRLFQIVQHLRARRLTTAAALADLLAVSERTIYRDIRDLSLSGIPVPGEAGGGDRHPYWPAPGKDEHRTRANRSEYDCFFPALHGPPQGPRRARREIV